MARCTLQRMGVADKHLQVRVAVEAAAHFRDPRTGLRQEYAYQVGVGRRGILIITLLGDSRGINGQIARDRRTHIGSGQRFEQESVSPGLPAGMLFRLGGDRRLPPGVNRGQDVPEHYC